CACAAVAETTAMANAINGTRTSRLLRSLLIAILTTSWDPARMAARASIPLSEPGHRKSRPTPTTGKGFDPSDPGRVALENGRAQSRMMLSSSFRAQDGRPWPPADKHVQAVKAIAQFLRYYLRPRPDGVTEVETGYRRDGERLPATLYRPAHGTGPLPGWVLLHGLTVPGREHTSLKRFARAVAASGAAVLVPDIPEWRALRVAPAVTVDTIRAAILALAERDDTIPGRIGVIGF